MKKITTLMLTCLATLSLTACNKEHKKDESKEETSISESESQEEVKINLNIAAPSGAPAVALYSMFKESNVEINASANNVIGYLSADSNKDIVIAPTNALVAITKKNVPFKIASTITFGNFFIASTGHDDNETMDKDDYVVLFQQNGLPDKLFQYVYGNDFTNLHYVEAASNANACLISGKNAADNNADVDYVLVPQPALSAGLSKNANAKQYASVQEDYKTKSGFEITQASIFIKDNTDEEQVKAFLNKVEKDIKDLLETPSLIKDATAGMEDEQVQAKFGTNATMLQKVLTDNSLGLGFKKAFENKSAIDNFLVELGFSNEETSENVYYK